MATVFHWTSNTGQGVAGTMLPSVAIADELVFFGTRESTLVVATLCVLSGSTMICTPASRAQEVGLALGAQAGQARLTDVLNQGGFSKVRRAAETPTNMVLEACR